MGTNSPRSFCEISELFKIWVDSSARGVHGPDHGADELVLQVRASRELSQGVVLGLLLQRLAFLQPVLDVGDHVAHAGVRVITGEQVVDLGDDLFEGHHFRIAGGAGAGLLGRLQRHVAGGLARGGLALVLGEEVEIDGGQVDLMVELLAG